MLKIMMKMKTNNNNSQRWNKKQSRNNQCHYLRRSFLTTTTTTLVVLVVSTIFVVLLSVGNTDTGVHAFSIGSSSSLFKTTTSTRDSRSRNNVFQLHQHQRKDDECDDDYVKESSPINNNSNRRRNSRNNNQWKSLLVAAAFVTASLGGGGVGGISSSAANANAAVDGSSSSHHSTQTLARDDLGFVLSPGTPTIETKVVGGDTSALFKSTETTITSLAKTVVLNKDNRVALTDSVKRVKTSIEKEVSSVQAWTKVIQILKDYGVDLSVETDVVVRPPSDWRRTYEDIVENKQVNVLVNGEILQITLEYQKGSNNNVAPATSTSTTDGKETVEASSSTTKGEAITAVVQPDDEWVLRIRGYKGVDPTAALNLASEPAKYDTNTIQFFRYCIKYWNSPLSENNFMSKVGGPTMTITNGDLILVEGVTAIGLSYAVSYAYYVDQIEKSEEDARQKQEKRAAAAKAKKEAAASAAAEKENNTKDAADDEKPKKQVDKSKPPKRKVDKSKPKEVKKEAEPVFVGKVDEPADKELVVEDAIDDDDDGDVKVVIDFDKDGKIVLTAIENSQQRPEGILAFLQALYFPWMGFFFSSPSSTVDDRPKLVAFAQALYFPWAGVFFPKNENNSDVDDDDDDNVESSSNAVTTSATTSDDDDDDKGNNGVLPLIRALWFPWVGIFQGK